VYKVQDSSVFFYYNCAYSPNYMWRLTFYSHVENICSLIWAHKTSLILHCIGSDCTKPEQWAVMYMLGLSILPLFYVYSVGFFNRFDSKVFWISIIQPYSQNITGNLVWKNFYFCITLINSISFKRLIFVSNIMISYTSLSYTCSIWVVKLHWLDIFVLLCTVTDRNIAFLIPLSHVTCWGLWN